MSAATGSAPVAQESAADASSATRPPPSPVLSRLGATAFIAPAAGLIGLFLVFPALWTLYLGLTDLRLTGRAAADPQFVGLDNLTRLFSDGQFVDSLGITLVFVAASAVAGQALVGFGLAWLYRGLRARWRKPIEFLAIMAWIVPASVVAFLWVALLDGRGGTFNALLPGDVTTEWLLRHPLASIVIFNIWRGSAFAMLLFAAALGSIPPSHLETASVLGAGTWAQLRDVVLPSIRGHIMTALLLLSLWTFNLFTPYLLTAGGPNRRTEVLGIYIFRTALDRGELGYGAAISAVMLCINLLIAVVYIRILRERRG